MALVLSLLISSANSARVTVENEYKAGRAELIHLDHYLAAYGPQTAEARAALRDAFAWIFALGTGPGRISAFGTYPRSTITIDSSRSSARSSLSSPTSDEHKWFQSQALRLTVSLAQIYHLVASQEGSVQPPWPVLFVVSLLRGRYLRELRTVRSAQHDVWLRSSLRHSRLRPPCS